MYFPLNYMHLVCLGVIKRFLLFWKEGPRPFRLEPFQIYQVSERLKKHDRINPLWVCSTDQRAGWTKQIKSYRIKNILLYVGPIVLKVIFTSYNTHSLLHLCDDSNHFQKPLDDISCFPFENYNQILKNYVRFSECTVQLLKSWKESVNWKFTVIDKSKELNP